MSRIVILGAVVMGTAFATPLSDNGFDVDLVGTHPDRDHIVAMQADRITPDCGPRSAPACAPTDLRCWPVRRICW